MSHFGLDKYSQALVLFTQIHEIQKTVFGEFHEDVARILHWIGRSHFELKDYSEGLEFLIKALEMKKKLHGDSHQYVANTLYWISKSHYQLAEYPEALASLDRAIKIYQPLSPEEQTKLTQCIDLREIVQKHLGDVETV